MSYNTASTLTAEATEQLFKVVGKDNLNRESIADVLLLESGSEEECEAFAKEYADERSVENNDYYMGVYYPFVVDIDAKLWRGMEEFM